MVGSRGQGFKSAFALAFVAQCVLDALVVSSPFVS